MLFFVLFVSYFEKKKLEKIKSFKKEKKEKSFKKYDVQKIYAHFHSRLSKDRKKIVKNRKS